MQASPLWARTPEATTPLFAPLFTPLIALVLALLLLVSGGCSRLRPNAPGGQAVKQAATSPLSQGRLQEVAPPAAAAAVAERLASRNPQVEILAPADDSLISDGPWTLQLQVRDWPLADSGSLGLGPHLVVQLDQQEPRRIATAAEAAAVAMPELQPGSHRITVYAARPWGEAVKSPGAMQQIRLHRVGRNAAELPARGSAQLIVASPDGLQQQEPVLIDWLLLDAPLQHLRDDDARWRLRVSVNGDSFLVDRQTPLWLKGFRRGSNAVQLELLDGRGEPLNPPFNSLVREVVIDGSERPAWQRSSLNAAELAQLSGEPPAMASTPAEPTAPSIPPAPAEPAEAPQPVPVPGQQNEQEQQTEQPEQLEREQTELAPAESGGGESATAAPEAEQPQQPDQPQPLEAIEASEAPAGPAEPEQQQPTQPATPDPPRPAQPSPATAPGPDKAPDPAASRISAGTSLAGSARELVNADGSLLKPKPRGPLAGLREKLGG